MLSRAVLRLVGPNVVRCRHCVGPDVCRAGCVLSLMGAALSFLCPALLAPAQLRGLLQKGLDATLPDGRVVKPEQVWFERPATAWKRCMHTVGYQGVHRGIIV